MRSWIVVGALMFASLPATSNYKLNSYGFGSGGTAGSQTATYSLEGISGELNGPTGSTSNYIAKPGFIQTQQAPVPLISLDNGSGQYYNKLHFVIDQQNNPTDATFLVAVTTDSSFSTGIMYLQPDGTLSSSLSLSDYQSYNAWGGSGGSYIIGLTPSTTYYAKVRATNGKFSESAFGPATPASATTAAPTISFSLVTSNQSSPPFSVSLGTLTAGSVNATAQTVNTSFSTNGASGGDVYITSKNGGLLSSSQGYKISAVSNNLDNLSEGFGVQNNSISQTSGGPFSVLSPYNGSGDTVGIVGSTTRSLYTASLPVTGGSGVFILKAKSASTDVAATDYQDILTLTASANF